MFALDVRLVLSVLLWSVCWSRLIRICSILVFQHEVHLLILSVSPWSGHVLGWSLTLIATYIRVPVWFKIEPHRFSLYLTLFGKSVCNSHGQQAQTLPILKLYKLPTIGAAEWLIGMQLVVEFIVSRGSEWGGGSTCRLSVKIYLLSR